MTYTCDHYTDRAEIEDMAREAADIEPHLNFVFAAVLSPLGLVLMRIRRHRPSALIDLADTRDQNRPMLTIISDRVADVAGPGDWSVASGALHLARTILIHDCTVLHFHQYEAAVALAHAKGPCVVVECAPAYGTAWREAAAALVIPGALITGPVPAGKNWTAT